MPANNSQDSLLYQKSLGCLLGGIIGDAMGAPTEGKHYAAIEESLGWVDDFSTDGTDDTLMKHMLAEALIRTDGYASLDDWAQVWLDQWDATFGSKRSLFFISVINAAQKLRYQGIPRMASLGNLPSSSSAMCISPVGIVNAGNPSAAALQAYNLSQLIHTYEAGFCQDGAACMAAAVAEAMHPRATVDSVLDAGIRAILPLSGREMLARIRAVMTLARQTNEYRAFRSELYSAPERFFCNPACDARETVPLTLALFLLAQGDLEKCVTYGANLGRDSDTIGSMAGAIAGAMCGAAAIRRTWIDKVQRLTQVNQAELASRLVATALAKHRRERAAWTLFDPQTSA